MSYRRRRKKSPPQEITQEPGSHALGYGTLKCVKVFGYDAKGAPINYYETRIPDNEGWMTPKIARRCLKMLGAKKFARVNIWENAS